jgi:cysteine synthase/rhodanese-related sulfurtransferase
METSEDQPATQDGLRKRFEAEIRSKVPHLRDGSSGTVVVNVTPLVDITNTVIECAKSEFGLDLGAKPATVYGKFESEIYGGSVKVRPAVQIIEQAIASGKLRRGMTVFEATSGNFGSALGMLTSLGFDVIALVSRKLQSGVLDELEKSGVKLVNMDVDICPAPGLQMDTNLLVAKTVASNIREQLTGFGLKPAAFDGSRTEVEQLLARQDVINLAKLLARIYQGFCPEQYDNELNVVAHETVTGPEIDQQLRPLGTELADFRLICTFGTGGTSTGVARYLKTRYDGGRVHVVFPLANQDVGGIRTREKAAGLKFYRPELYAGQHEVDFECAKRVLKFFTKKGYNMGESSALAIYACIQMLNFGTGDKFVIVIADGIQKYVQTLQTSVQEPKRYEVTLQEARSNLHDYAGVLWTHTMFAPKEGGIKVLAGSLGCEESMVKIAQTKDVARVITGQELPDGMRALLPQGKGKFLLVCMVGGTSLKIAKLLSEMGVDAESLTGGIMGVPEGNGAHPSELVELARE